MKFYEAVEQAEHLIDYEESKPWDQRLYNDFIKTFYERVYGDQMRSVRVKAVDPNGRFIVVGNRQNTWIVWPDRERAGETAINDWRVGLVDVDGKIETGKFGQQVYIATWSRQLDHVRNEIADLLQHAEVPAAP